jgi:hypothetical protein
MVQRERERERVDSHYARRERRETRQKNRRMDDNNPQREILDTGGSILGELNGGNREPK